VQEISGDFFILQQGSAPAHRERDTIKRLELETPAFIAPELWPQQSRYFNPVNYKIWGEMQQRSGLPDKSSWPGWTEAASYRCVAWLGSKHHRWRNWWVAQTSACVYSCQRRTFWAFALTQWHAYDNLNLSSLWILKENCCYCVKYVRFLLFLIFCISQGSVATRLRCGGKYNNSFAANVLLSPAVKGFLKSVNICQSYA